ncbi:MAG: DUF4340 domain-containing protein [Deltaproteobacteria bacterium]|nr:DUF4340 domain-containing protein [Deltaproteobacteria bacterium]
MKRSVTLHAALLLGVLIAAYCVWTRDRSSTKDDERPVLALRQVDRVIYDAPGERKVEVTRKTDAQGVYYWVSVEKWERPRPPRGARLKGRAMRPQRRGASTTAAKAPAGKAPAGKAPVGKPVFRSAPAKKRAVQKKAANTLQKKAADVDKSLRRDPKANPNKPAAPKPAVKATPIKATPAKATPIKATPAKATPIKARPIKATPAKARPKVRKDSQFIGNKATEELMKTLAKLPAIRSLGTLAKEKLEEFGLTTSDKTLTIIEGSNTRVFTVGKRTHGNMDYYLQDRSDQRVYVVRPRAMQDLSYAEYRLMERNLHTFDTTEFDRVRIRQGNKGLMLQQHNRRKPSKATYSRLGGDGKAKAHFRAWMQKLGRLRTAEYPKADTPLKGLTPVVKVEFFNGQKKLGTTELLVLQKGITGPANYYARSETSRVVVKVNESVVKELEKDLPILFAE